MKTLLTLIFAISIFLSGKGFSQSETLNNENFYSSNSQFLENKGQWDKSIRFVSLQNGMNLVIKNDGLYFDVYNTKSKDNNLIFKSGTVIKTSFIGSEPFQIKQLNYLPGIYNFLKTNNSENWITGVRASKEILLSNVYKGIDIRLMMESNNPRYDFIIYPGANPNQICMNFEGTNQLTVSGNELVISAKQGEIKHSQVRAYQVIDGKKIEVSCNFVKNQKGIVFNLAQYNKNYPLTIDPTVFSDYVGGSGDDAVASLKMMPNGYVVVAGWTGSNNFMTTPGVYDSLLSGDKDVFVRKYKVAASTRELVFSTIIGGTDADKANGVDFDDNSDIYITGATSSADYPTLNSINLKFAGVTDGFITKLSIDGKSILYSSYFGGSKEDVATDITVDADRSVAICGYTNSMNYNIYGSADQTSLKGLYDAFITKINTKGTSYVFSSYWGGTSNDKANAIKTDSEGFLFVVGETNSADFPIVPYRVSNGGWGNPPAGTVLEKPYSLKLSGGIDAWAMKMSSSGSGTEYSTFFGGKADDRATGVTYAEDGTLVFCGETSIETGTAIFPTSASPYSKVNKGGVDGFAARLDKIKISTAGGGGGPTYTTKNQDLIFSTFFGGSTNDYVSSMSKFVANDGFYIVGKTNSSTFPIVGDDVVKKIAGKYDAYVVKISTYGTDLIWSTFYGGSGDEEGLAVSSSPTGEVYIAGSTASPDIIKPNINFQPKYGGGVTDGFITKMTMQTLEITYPFSSEQFCAGSSVDIKWNTMGYPVGEKFEVVYRLKQTDNWIAITQTAVDGSYKWAIPTLPYPEDSVQLRIQHPSGLWKNSEFFKLLSSPKAKIVSFTPDNNTPCETDDITIKTEVYGTNLAFKWYLNNVQIPEQTGKDLIIKNVKMSNSGKYKLVCSGTCKPDITTAETQFIVNPKTKITQQPLDVKLRKGENTKFTVKADGLDLTYEWQRNGSRIMNATESTYSLEGIQKASEGKYSCVVNGKCYSDTSYAAQLEVDTTTISVFDMPLSDGPNLRILTENSSEIQFVIGNVNNINTIVLTNIEGISVANPEFNSNSSNEYSSKIDKSNLPSGVYFLLINSNTGICSRKLNIIK